jgi:hypothetical protein
MATDPTVINDGTADKTYKLVSLTEKEALWRDQATSMSEPSTLRISHQPAKDSSGLDRHLIALSMINEDEDDEQTPYQGTVHVVIAAPRKAVTEAELLKEWIKLETYVTTNFAALYDGFMP